MSSIPMIEQTAGKGPPAPPSGASAPDAAVPPAAPCGVPDS